MKKLLLTLVFGLLAHAGLFAQQQLTVQGFVRTPAQVPVANQAVYILSNPVLTAQIYDTVYTDTAGFYSKLYTLPGTNLQGIVFVMTDCGMMDSVSGIFSPNITAITLNLTCRATPPPGASGWINGWVTPVAVGDTAKIELLALRNGAIVVDTTIYRWDSIASGYINYGFFRSPGTYTVRASLTPGSVNFSTRQATYYGQTTNQNQATTFIVSAGVVLNGVNITLLTTGTNPSLFVSGIVSGYAPRAVGIDTVRVILIEINGMTWTPIDTTYATDSAGTSFYYFTPANAGTYTILATLLTGHAANYVPTYYGNATTWSSSYSFSLNPVFNQRAANITLQAATGTGNGGGSIGGGVFNGGLPFVGNGGIQGMPVQLKDGMDNILRVVHTNTDGSFNLSDLPFGTYYLRVEMFGLTSAVSTVVLDAANPSQQGVNFTINGSGIVTSIAEDAIKVKAVYPNPATDRISIGLKATEGAARTLQLRDLQGRVVLEETVSLTSGEQVIVLDLAGIQKGMYLLHVEGASSLVQKIMVQ